MMMGDFITLSQVGLPIKVVVLNNGTLGFVEMEMKANGFLDAGCDLRTRTSRRWRKRWASRAGALNGHRICGKGWRRRSAMTACTRGCRHARQELVLPPKTTLDQAGHFGMFMIRAVLDGRAGELIELAKVNLTR